MSNAKLNKKSSLYIKTLHNLQLKSLASESNISPYSQNLSNSISHSKIKRKSMHTPSNSILLKSMNSNSSFVFPNRKTPKIFNDAHIIKKISPEEKLEKALTNELKNQVKSDKFEIFQEFFNKFSSLLGKIKAAYDEKLEFLNCQNLNSLYNEINDLKQKYKEKEEENNGIKEKFQKLLKENNELISALEKTESLYLEVQGKLQKIYDTDIDDYPQSIRTWKHLINEYNHLLKAFDKLNKENRMLSAREKQCVALIIELKERGFPVKEVYENMDHSEEIQEHSSVHSEHETDNEALVSGRLEDVKRPDLVPPLNLDLLSSENSYINESD